MGEREPRKEIIRKGELYFLHHPGTENTFSGYGLTTHVGRKDQLAGALMVDRPRPVDPEWLRRVEEAFGETHLIPMTDSGDRGILCRMQIEPGSTQYVRQYPLESVSSIQEALKPLLDQPPKPVFRMRWDEEQTIWKSQIQFPNELPEEVRTVLEKTGYGCLAVEADIGVVHVCHAPDTDIAGFEDKLVITRWQLIKMPTAPLIRLELIILDNPETPFRFESFLNAQEEDQANILAELANQDRLYLAFYGDDLSHHYTKVINHDVHQWQLLDELTKEADQYWRSLPPGERDFDRAKGDFMSLYP